MVPATGVLVGGSYEIVRALASGGMGSVWLARHTELDVDVAVKFMQPEQATAQAEARFKREARSAAKLKSPHIVQIHDYGVSDGTAYMVMKLLHGDDLSSVVRREGRLSPSRASAICAQACKGLLAAHQAGIVHRDLKPSNLFLARSGTDEVVKILDFGIAKDTALPVVTTDKTASGVVLGSPHYMSPEQARGAPVDARTDLWSMAVVLYEILTGARPFEAQHLGELIARILYEPFVLPSVLVPGLPAEVDRFFARALARAPANRYASASELADAFASAASQPHVRVASPSAARRACRDDATLDQAAHVVPTGRPAATAPDSAMPTRTRRPTPAVVLAVGGVVVAGSVLLGAWRRLPREQAIADAQAESDARSSTAPVDSAHPSTASAEQPPVAPVVVAPFAPATGVASSTASTGVLAATPRPAPKASVAAKPAPAGPPSAIPKTPPASAVDPTFGLPVSKP